MAEKRDNRLSVAPPKWANRFLEWYCATELLDEVQGDLHEAFYFRVKRYGLQKAKWLFVKEVLLFCRPSSFKKNTPSHYVTNPNMFQNYLKIAFRNLLKSKAFSAINVFGLAIGLAACFLIMQYVLFELSYDTFHENSDRIYRVLLEDSRSHTGINAANHPAAGPALVDDLPEVKNFARVVHQSIFMNAASLSYSEPGQVEKVFNQDKIYFADTSFLTIFSFPFIFGDPARALTDPNSVVISQSVSEKFFGGQDPLGKVLRWNGEMQFTVTGVFEDVPPNSHIKFDVLFSMNIMGENFGYDRWSWPEYYTYILLDTQADPAQATEKLPELVQKYLGDNTAEYGYEAGFRLQPLTDIHLRSPNATKEREVHGNERTVYFLVMIAIFILVIAWINYVNLSTSKSLERAQEVGLRKVAGASRFQLITQFLFESVIINFIAIILSLLLVVISLPYFKSFIGGNIDTNLWEVAILRESQFWVILVGLFILGSCLAGLYPAFVLSSFRVSKVLKGKFYRSDSGIILRKILVGFQYGISVALIAGTLMVFKQVSFMRSQDLGFAGDQTLIIRAPTVIDTTIHTRIDTYKNALTENPQINQVTFSSQIPGIRIEALNGMRRVSQSKDKNIIGYNLAIDPDFLETYDLNLIAGRNFKKNENEYQSDSDIIPVLVNERAVEMMGFQNFEEAIQQRLHYGSGIREIIGVVENHHQQSLRKNYDAIIFHYSPGYRAQYLSVNLEKQHLSQTISFVGDQYKDIFPGNPFEYFFLDDYFNRQYAADQQFGRVFGLFSALALIVACLGLFGLSTFMISQRVKEIAVRKVLGATISSMAVLFSKDFVRLILLANLIALPLVYLGVQRWLNNFAFQVHIGWLIFVVPAVILLVISLSTVSFQTLKTGSGNPIDHLRQE
ncbi:MAG: ABC transporter permease [Bacteroidota bacterium]